MDHESIDEDGLKGAEEAYLKITPERWAEIDAMAASAAERMELENLVPIDNRSEKYIERCYPIAVLYGRSDIQELAETYHDAHLTEEEIEKVRDQFFDDFPLEFEFGIRAAIEAVLEERIPRNFETTS